MAIFFIVLSALLASTFSAIAGLGGGLILYFVIGFFYPLSVVIPLHGFGMLIGNSSRSYLLRSYLKKKVLFFIMLGAPLGTVLGVYLLKQDLPKNLPYYLILFLILYTLFKPSRLPEFKLKDHHYIYVAIFAGLLGVFIGATGSFVKIFFRRSDFSKEESVANESFTQTMANICKIPAFITLGFDYMDHVVLLSSITLASILGSILGVYILKAISVRLFQLLFNIVLSIAGLRIIWMLIYS